MARPRPFGDHITLRTLAESGSVHISCPLSATHTRTGAPPLGLAVTR